MDSLGDDLILRILDEAAQCPADRRALAPVCRRFESAIRSLQSKLVIDFSTPPGKSVSDSGQGRLAAALLRGAAKRRGQIKQLAALNLHRPAQRELLAYVACLLESGLVALEIRLLPQLANQPVPQWVTLHSKLQNLTLSRIQELPQQLGQLTSLTRLAVENSALFDHCLELPPDITCLQRLQEMSFLHTSVSGLQLDLLGRLPDLGVLHLERALGFPNLEWVQGLTQITCLKMRRLNERSGPFTVQQMDAALQPLTQLRYLDLSSNLLDMLPPSVARLPHLGTLLLFSNAIRRLPTGDYLATLQRLDLACTSVDELPDDELHTLSQLSRLCIGQGQRNAPSSAEHMERWRQQLEHLPCLRLLELAGEDYEAHAPDLRQQLQPGVAVSRELFD